MKTHIHVTSLAVVNVLVGACALGLSPMIDYSTLRTQRRAQFFVDGNTIVIKAANPQGENLALDVEPRLDQGRVVMVAGVTSSGTEGVKTYCRDIGLLSPPPDWATRLFWRNRNGELVHIQSIDRGGSARQLIGSCCGASKPTCPPSPSSAAPPDTALQRTVAFGARR